MLPGGVGSRHREGMNRNRIRHRVRVGGLAVLAVMALAADPVANATTSDFIAAAQAVGVTGAEPAIVESGEDACREIWDGQQKTIQGAVADLQRDYPTLTADQATRLIRAAYQDLCPTGAPGEYDWWSYSNGSG
jgi:hypothetical protein